MFLWQEIRSVQMELEELVMQEELEGICSGVECMIQSHNPVADMQELSQSHSSHQYTKCFTPAA